MSGLNEPKQANPADRQCYHDWERGMPEWALSHCWRCGYRVQLDAYPVGFAADVLRWRRGWPIRTPEAKGFRRASRKNLISSIRRQWRTRSYWNGWLAEATPFPPGVQYCGSGLTPARARRNWRHQLRKAGYL